MRLDSWKNYPTLTLNWEKNIAYKKACKFDQVEHSETSEISEILESFFRDFWIRVFDFGCREKEKTWNNFSEISEVSEFSICHFFIFCLNFFFLFVNVFSVLQIILQIQFHYLINEIWFLVFMFWSTESIKCTCKMKRWQNCEFLPIFLT